MRNTLVTAVLSFILGLTAFYLYNEREPEKVIESTVQQVPVTTDMILADLYGLPFHQSRILGLIIDDAAKQEAVPAEYLIAIIKVESDFNARAKSSEGAIGFAQIKPEYWNHVKGYNVYDAYENIYLSAHILQEYYSITKDWDKAFKAYNVGITNFRNGKQVKSSIRYNKKINAQLVKINDYIASQKLLVVAKI